MTIPRFCMLRVPYAGHVAEAHTLAWHEWGDERAFPVLCVHGLTRNGRDFDFLAQALAGDFRVIAVDMPGRGKSEWLKYKEEYNLASYMANLAALLDYLRIRQAHWVGTSMGGILGMMFAAQFPQRVARLVLNDVGAQIPGAALARLAQYVGIKTRYETRTEAETALRAIYAPFHIQDEQVWKHLFAHGLQDMPDGSVRVAYDPAIRAGLDKSPAAADISLWEWWNKIVCPVLVIRGSRSDLLTEETAAAMQRLRPGTRLHTVWGAGHAPLLENAEEMGVIVRFLEGPVCGAGM